MLLRFEDVLEGQALSGFAGTKADMELSLIAAQAVQSHDLSQSGLYYAPTFLVNIFPQSTDLQCLLKGSQSIGALMLVEREQLLPLATEGFDLASLHFPHVYQSGCVKVLTNYYSTPLAAGTRVEVKVYSAYIEVWHSGHCRARHERCYERHQQILELEHYLDVLQKKPGALAGSTALEQCR